MSGLGHISYTVQNPNVVIERTIVEVPDNERGAILRYRGATVRNPETGIYLGDCWFDSEGLCWRTVGSTDFGHANGLREAARILVSKAR